MSELIIYGASDDLIEIEGDFQEEFSTGASGEETVAVVGLDFGGLALVIPYLSHYDGYWTAQVKLYGQAVTWEEQVIDRPHGDSGGDQGVKLTFPDTHFKVFKTVKY